MSASEPPSAPRPLPADIGSVLDEHQLAYLREHGVVTREQLWEMSREALGPEADKSAPHLAAIDGGLWVILEAYLREALPTATRTALEEGAEAEAHEPRTYGVLPPLTGSPDAADDEQAS